MLRNTGVLCFLAIIWAFPACAQDYGGNVDNVACNIIGGWAWDATQPNTPISVDIYDGNTYLLTTTANGYRPDLYKAGYGNGYHGFTITTPSSLLNDQYHYIYAKYHGTNLIIPNSDWALYCSVNSTGYIYYDSDTFSSIDPAAWYQNGSITTGTGGLTSSAADGGSVISKVGVPDGSSQYEVKATLTLNAPTQSGETYALYLRGTSNALSGPAPSGSYYSFELQNPTFNGSSCTASWALYQSVNGSVTNIGGGAVGCHTGMTIRLIYGANGWIIAYVDNNLILWTDDELLGNGQPGVGVRSAAASNGIARVDLGPLDRIAPQPFQAPITTSAFPTQIDMAWTGVADDSNGTGVAFYEIDRNSVGITDVGPEWPNYSDTTLTASTTYTYTLRAYDYHLNQVSTTFTAATPPSEAIDPRQVGVRPLGSYWGGAGEQMDLRSGNLNYTIPLIKAMGRGGWSVGFNLTYNSQNWRQDPGGIWQLGRDTGYGYGWRLQAGSLTPVWSGYWNIAYWLFIDSTGAEYKLNQWNGSVWTSVEGIYLTFNPAVTGSPGSTHLYFPDGSFWELNALSAGTEQDAGTYYPTLMEDTNGNQITISYEPGAGVSYANSSSRISTIQDVRGGLNTDYTFLYNYDVPTPHLISITNSIQTSENYAFSYTASSGLFNPFTHVNMLTVRFLQSVAANSIPAALLTTSFTYDTSGHDGTSGTGELLQVMTPYGASISWVYGSFTYVGSRTLREVQGRSLAMASGAPELSYVISRGDPGDPSRSFHYWATIDDPDGQSEKAWWFQTDNTKVNYGLLNNSETRPHHWPNTAGSHHDDYTWTTNASGNPYISVDLTTEDDYNSTAVQKQTTQVIDQYGNLTQMKIFDYGNLSTPSRIYTNTYLTGSNYASQFIFNRLLTSTVSNYNYGLTTTLMSKNYDVYSYCQGGMTYVSALDHDANYGTSFIYRGNPTAFSTPTSSGENCYDMTGNITSTTSNGVTTTSNIGQLTNWAAPSSITTNSLTTSMSWEPFLGLSSASGPNTGDTVSITYDANARPATTTSPDGATTTYTYNDTASPPTRVATTNGHWVRTTMDGFGRTIKTETGYGSTTVSQTETVYGPCGCSPLGKITQQSLPHSPSGAVYWTTYTYDGLGRTTQIRATDGSATNYSYWSNVSQVIDPAGNWKNMATDAFGNLTTVVEPDPALGAVTTSYTYDILNHLTSVSMPRGSNTQTRTFNYTSGNYVGAFLLSATNPENGTVSYTYNGNYQLATKTDAKGQVFTYNYDIYNRLSQISAGGTVLRTFIYDANPLDSTFSQNPLGRLVAVQNAPYGTNLNVNSVQFTEMYSYKPSGRVSGKRLQVNENIPWYPSNVNQTLNLDALYTYDSEGKMTSVQYPSTYYLDANGYTLDPLAGPKYTYSFDSMDRPIGLTDQNNYSAVTGVQYGGGTNSPPNAITSMSYFGASETRSYNSLGQLNNISIPKMLNLTYNYPTGNNNGKISSLTDAISGETVTYTYDYLNRLLSANGSGWTESYAYDSFGNLTTKTPSGGAPQLSVGVNAANNQLVNVTSYDANGNQQSYNGIGLIYDAENHLLSAVGLTDYLYDSQGKRIWKGTFSKGTMVAQEVYFYGVDGQKLGTYSLSLIDSNSTVYLTDTNTDLAVFFGARRVGVNGAAFVPDRLGSNTGSYDQGKFYPYGEDRGTPLANDQVKFATYTRDSATGLDYADQRYYSNQFGRFMTADPYRASANPSNPTSWNRYAYVSGDPINANDRTGLDGQLSSQDPSWCDDHPDDGSCTGGIYGSGYPCPGEEFIWGPNPYQDQVGPPQPPSAPQPMQPGPLPCPTIPVADDANMFAETVTALTVYALSPFINTSSYKVSPGGSGVIYDITNVQGFKDALTTGPYAECFGPDMWYLLHTGDVGNMGPYSSWRGYRGPGYSLGGSLQIVISSGTDIGYADIDQYNTQDVMNILPHLWGIFKGILHKPGRISAPALPTRPLPNDGPAQ